MAIALVSAGAGATGSTSVTPTFGQATSSGSLLVAFVFSFTTTSATTSTGWQKTGNFSLSSQIYYKMSSVVSEVAPTFSCVSGTITAVLAEFSGVALTSALDKEFQDATSSSTSSPYTLSNTAADQGPNGLVVASIGWVVTKSSTATFTDSWSPAGGVANIIISDPGTKQTTHFNAPYYIFGNSGGGTAADSVTESIGLSNGAVSSVSGSIASFRPPSTFLANQPKIIGQSIKRSSLY